MRPDPAVAGAAAPSPKGAVTGRRASRRARRLARLTLVLSLTPGMVITMLLAPTLQSPTLLAIGAALVITAFLAHRRLTAALVRLTAAPGDPGQAPNAEIS